MNISIDFDAYLQHNIFFDAMATAMQKDGHRVGILTSGVREGVKEPASNSITKDSMMDSIHFTPDFVICWGQFETIANGSLWKAERMDLNDITVHFDDDAAELKRYTDRWVMKVLLNGQETKF